MTARRGDRHLSWERFESLIIAGPPAVERVAGEPRVEIFTDPGGSRIGVRIFSVEPAPLTPLVEMDTRRTVVDGHTAIEIAWTLAPALILVFIAVPTIRTIFKVDGAAPPGARPPRPPPRSPASS